MGSIYDTRTPSLLPHFNALLSRHYLPTITHPSEITTSLLIALYESLIQSRLSAINRKDKTQSGQIRNVKLLLGEMVMAGWDVGMIDPVGVVEREETCLMDMVEVLVEIGREKYGTVLLPSKREDRKELSTITELSTEGFSSEVSEEISDSESSTSTVREIHQRADEILSRIHALNPSTRRPTSPTGSVVSRGTQTSPPLPSPPIRTRTRIKVKRTPRRPKQEKSIQTDTDSGIPTSTALSYSSDSSISTIRPTRPRHRKPPHSPIKFSPLPKSHSTPILPSRSRSRSSSDSFKVDSPYKAALRRRRQKALTSLHRRPKIRILSIGREPGDSTFAEDSEPSTPPPRILPSPRSRRRVIEESTDGVTDLERRVKALRVWKGIEEERKEFLLGEIQRKKREGSESGRSRSLGYL